MNDTQLLSSFKYLFRGREDIYGAVHGECVKEPITQEMWAAHLFGEGSIGVYPLVQTSAGGQRVPWGCTDIDDGYERSLPLAKNMHRALKLLGLSSWVEITKGKGFHVWVFAQGWVASEQMRNALLLAHQVAGVRPTEVNPKSATGGKGGNGNYVNVPYAATFAADGRRVVLDPTSWEPMDVQEFTQMASASLNTVQAVLDAAGRYVPPPPPPRVDIEQCSDADLAELTKQGRMPGLAFRIFNEGPLEGRDRSGTLARLSHLLAESDAYTAGEALALLTDADIRWGKFIEAGRDEELHKMIGAAFGKRAQERSAD